MASFVPFSAYVLSDDQGGPVLATVTKVHMRGTKVDGYDVEIGGRKSFRLAIFDTAEEATLVYGLIAHDYDL